MSTLDSDSLSKLNQILSSMDLSPEIKQSLLQNPERAMDLVKRSAAQTTAKSGEALPYIGGIEQELEEEDARCKEEAQLPLRKPAPTKHTDLELNNKRISTHKSTFLKTFFGKKTHFSTTPVTQLTRST